MCCAIVYYLWRVIEAAGRPDKVMIIIISSSSSI